MTVKELYEQTALLGFENSLDSTEGFFHAANRAILQVNSLRPAIRSFTIHHKSLDNIITEDTFSPVDIKEDVCYEAYGVKAYYFEADGNGIVKIEARITNEWDEAEWKEVDEIELSSQRKFKAYKGFIKNGENFFEEELIRIRFTGNYIYSIKNVAMYAHLYSDAKEDIPAYEPYANYNIPQLVSDFLSLAKPPILEGESKHYLNKDYEVEENNVISVSSNFSGIVRIVYKHKPNKLIYSVSPKEDDTPIDLDEELCELLPMLVASFIWAEDEPELANYYMNIYREWAQRIELLREDHSVVTIKNTNGW